jgi:GNAT superfamily N-acetyltransferase
LARTRPVFEKAEAMMTDFTIKTATTADASAVIDLLVLAFSTDPFMRWMYPDPHRYLSHCAAYFRTFSSVAFTQGTAYFVGDYTAAALWLPPGIDVEDDDGDALLQTTVSEGIKKNLFPLFEQLEAYLPAEPYWYLPLIGVDPTRQGKGYGSALLRYSLARCDRDRNLAYLESSNPANIPLYERHGFEVLDTIQVGGSPPLFPMLRQPQ